MSGKGKGKGKSTEIAAPATSPFEGSQSSTIQVGVSIDADKLLDRLQKKDIAPGQLFQELGLPPEATMRDARKRILELTGKKGVKGTAGPTLTPEQKKARRAERAKLKRQERNEYLAQFGLAPRPKAPKGSKSDEEKKAERAARAQKKREQNKQLRDWMKENKAKLKEQGFDTPF